MHETYPKLLRILSCVIAQPLGGELGRVNDLHSYDFVARRIGSGLPCLDGGYLASRRVAGKVQKVLISSYGGFFYDQEAGTFYELQEGMVRDWNGFLTRAYFKIPL